MIRGVAHSKPVTRLLVVDNHPIIHEGLTHLASRERDLRVVWKALSVDEALTICADNIPDMAIVGIALGDRSGLELVKALHGRWPLFPMLVMSIYDDSLYAGRSLRAGARGYIMKRAIPGHIIDAIRKVRDGGIYMSDKAQAELMERAIAGVDLDLPAAIASLSDRGTCGGLIRVATHRNDRRRNTLSHEPVDPRHRRHRLHRLPHGGGADGGGARGVPHRQSFEQQGLGARAHRAH